MVYNTFIYRRLSRYKRFRYSRVLLTEFPKSGRLVRAPPRPRSKVHGQISVTCDFPIPCLDPIDERVPVVLLLDDGVVRYEIGGDRGRHNCLEDGAAKFV